ncbi:MAG: hypothetical protein ABIH39_04520 [Candidatus Margulisiibacteriota bacterium]
MRKKILLWVLFFVIVAFGIQYKDKKVLWSAAGDPVYVPGSTEITTLGAITTGTWTGDAITDPYISNTITLDNINQITTRPVTSLTGGNWKTFFTNGSGTPTELALGTAAKVLTANGVAAAPTWETVSAGILNWSVVNAASADQGVDDNLDSVKDLVDEIGANPGVLYFGHTSGAAQTTYLFSTSETIPANITLVIDQGAVLAIDDASDVTIKGSVGAKFYQIFDEQSTGSFLFGVYQDITDTGGVREVYPDWWGAAVDGATDDGPEIQKAIDSLSDNGGIVFLRAGVWKVDTQINVGRGRTIQGTGWSRSPWLTEMSVSDLRSGTWIAQDSNITIFNIIYNGTVIKDLAFYQQHPNPETEAAWDPTAYTSYLIKYWGDTATSDPDDRPDNSILENLLLLNIYNGILISEDGLNAGAAVWMKDIRAQCFNRFFRSEWNWGGLRFHNVELWPFWTVGWAGDAESPHYKNVLQDQKANLIAFDLLMADGAQFDNIAIYGAAYGFSLSMSSDPGHAPSGLIMNNIGIEQLQLGIVINIDITGANEWRNIWLNNIAILGDAASSWGIYVNGDGYTIKINNAWLGYFTSGAIVATGNATGNVFLIDNTHIDNWDSGDSGIAAIYMDTGNTAYIGNNMFYENAGPGNDAPWLGGAGTVYTSAGSVQQLAIVASAGTIAIPPGVTSVLISGSTTVTGITGGYHGRIVVLVGSSSGSPRQITDGGALNLAGDMSLADNCTLTLIASSATAWSEISRSVN